MKSKIFKKAFVKLKSGLVYGLPFLLIFAVLFFVFSGKNENNNSITEKIKNNSIVKNLSKIKENSIPKIYGANFDLNYKKIPASQKNIEFYMQSDIDPKTVNKNTFSVFPEKKGKIIVEKNIIKYEFLENLKPGEKLDFILSKNIKTKDGKNLDKDYEFGITVVEKAKVTKIFPDTSKKILKNLNQKILVFFNVPIVPLTNLDNKDLACPIEITPKIEGNCRWITTSIVEFRPKDRFKEASEYKINVVNKKGFLYKFEEKKDFIIKTLPIKFYSSFDFNPKNGIEINSNFPVVFEDLEKNTFLYETKKDFIYTGKTPITEEIIQKNSQKLDIKLEKISDTNFKILLKNGNFLYGKKFFIVIKSNVKPKYGNIPTKTDFIKKINSKNFINNIVINREIFSSSGTLLDSISNTYNDYNKKNIIGIKNYYLVVNFLEEVNLDKNNFVFLDKQNNKKINLKISYLKTKDKKTKKDVINKKAIKIEFLENLENNKIYNLIIKKSINSNLGNDIVKEFFTPEKLKVKDFEILNYKKACIYTNNQIFQARKRKKDFLDISPKAKIAYISEGYDYPDYNLRKAYDFKDIPDEVLKKNGYCRKAKKGEFLYIVHLRLNPNTEYKIKISKNLKDIYGSKISNNKTITYKTGEIKDEDKNLYFISNNIINTIPVSAGINFGIESTNLSKVKLVIGELDVIDFLKNSYKIPYNYKNNPKYFVKEIDLKNKNWDLSINTFSLEKDILKRKPKTNIVQIGALDFGKNKKRQETVTYIRSNLSIVLEVPEKNPVLFVTDFNGKALGDVVFDFYRLVYDNDYRVIDIIKDENIKYEVKGNGVYILKNTTNKDIYNTKKPLVIVARDDLKGYFGMLDTRFNEVSNYDFKYISGISSTREQNYLYLYTERPIYKPGDKVYLKGILRKFLPTGYTKTDIKEAKLEVINPKGKVIKILDLKIDNSSNFSASFEIPKEVPTGRFSFRFKTGKDTIRNNAHFFVEEYKKPVFKIEVKEDKKDFQIGEKTTNIIEAKYYFGGKLKNTNGEYSILTQNYFFDAKDFGNYKFGEGYAYYDCLYWGYCNYDDELEFSGDFKIGENGQAKIVYEFPKKIEQAEKIYNFNVEIKDPDTKKVVRKYFSKILHITDAYVGLDVNYFVEKNKNIEAEAIVLDWNAKPLANKKIKVSVIKLDWQKVKKQGVDGNFYYNYELKEVPETKKEFVSDKNGKAKISIKPKKSGTYLLKVEYTGKNGKTFVSSENIFVESQEYISWRNDNNSITELTPLKQEVNIGDKAEYILKSPINTGKAIIFVEKDNGILDYFIHDIKSYSDKIIIDVKQNYYPNYYLKVFLIGKNKNSLLPVYKRALASTKVNTEFKKLNIKIKTDKKNYLPREKIKLEIKVLDYNNKPVSNADLSIGIVDESLLALKGNPKKNPYAFFYDLKRYLGVNTYLSLSNLVDKLEIKDTRNGEKGGSGDRVKGGDSKKKRGIFKDTAFFKASISTNENGVAILETDKLPDNLTTWVIEVVGNTEDTKVGVAYETVLTTKKLQINDNLPNFVGSKDIINFSPVLFNRTGKDGEFEISLSGENFEIIGDSKKNIFLKNNSSKTVLFKVKISDIGIINGDKQAKINLKLVSKDKKFSDEIEKFLEIKATSTKENVTTTGKTKTNSYKEIIDLSNLKQKTGNLEIIYSKTLLSSLLNSIDYLDNYPYGCSEQQTSAIMPNIYIKKLYDSAGIEFDLSKKMLKKYYGENEGFIEISLKNVIENYLARIGNYQNFDGGFAYFPQNHSNFYLSAYILDSLSKIRDIGFKVDEELLEKTSKYLKNEFYHNSRTNCYNILDCNYSISEKLKALNAILTYDNNDYEVYKMYKILTQEKIAPNNKKTKVYIDKLDESIFLAKLINNKNLKVIEKENLTKKLKENLGEILKEKLSFSPKGAFVEGYSRLDKTTKLLKAISLAGNIDLDINDSTIENMVRWIISQKKSDSSFGSTQDTIKVIEALTLYIEKSGNLKNVDDLVSILLNSKIISKTHFTDKNKLDVIKKNLSLKNLKEKNEFIINKTGKGNLYYELNLGYYLNSEDIKARDNGFFVEKKYYNYEEYKDIENKKKEEQKKFEIGEISYKDLKYPKEIVSYLKEVKNPKVGDLLVVYNKIITPESRDKVFFEGFIPSGATLINPNLETSTKKNVSKIGELDWNTKEYRLDRFFAYKENLFIGEYYFTYLIRITYSGEFNIKPTKIGEFYNTEVFGRTSGEKMEVK